jgi:hypothetical protein
VKPQHAKRFAAILILFGCLIVSVVLVVGYFFDALPEIGTVMFAFLVLAYLGIIAAVSFVQRLHWLRPIVLLAQL